MNANWEERILLLLLIFFFMFISIYRPNYHDHMSNVEIISENRDSIIIKENDTTKKISKVCTHMGCLLNLDRQNKKLICPCHNSEFGLTGNVLVGPARENLEVQTLSEKFQNYQNRKKLDW